MRYRYDCVLRWSDLDAFGHVNNARFLTLYEEARVALMFTAASRHGLTSFAEGVVIARHEVDYLRPVPYFPVTATPIPAAYPVAVTAVAEPAAVTAVTAAAGTGADPVTGDAATGTAAGAAGAEPVTWPTTGPSVRIEMWVEEMRPSRFVIAYELFADGMLASRARSVCVPYDLAAGRPRRLRPVEREFLQPWTG